MSKECVKMAKLLQFTVLVDKLCCMFSNEIKEGTTKRSYFFDESSHFLIFSLIVYPRG